MMSDLQREMEDEFIERQKDKAREAGGEVTHREELIARVAYSEAARLFRVIGLHEGDRDRVNKIIEALGIVREEPGA